MMDELTAAPPGDRDPWIVATPGTLGGRPHIRGHRIGVSRIKEMLASGMTVAQIAAEYDWVPRAGIEAAAAWRESGAGAEI